MLIKMSIIIITIIKTQQNAEFLFEGNYIKVYLKINSLFKNALKNEKQYRFSWESMYVK